MERTTAEVETRLSELADFLRTRRNRISPESVGIERSTRRRSPGLRREEVAVLAGVSVDWYTWLEQGRNIQVSDQVLESLSRALQLDATERKHLFMLAAQYIPFDPVATTQVSAPLQRYLNHLGATPAFVIDPFWNIAAWNSAACALYGDYESMPLRERNILWLAFTSEHWRALLGDAWEGYARRRVAQFRAIYARDPSHPEWQTLIEDLNRVSAAFREWWPNHDVLDTLNGSKLLHHPVVGPLALDHISFRPSEAPELLVTVNVPLAEYDTPTKLGELLSLYLSGG